MTWRPGTSSWAQGHPARTDPGRDRLRSGPEGSPERPLPEPPLGDGLRDSPVDLPEACRPGRVASLRQAHGRVVQCSNRRISRSESWDLRRVHLTSLAVGDGGSKRLGLASSGGAAPWAPFEATPSSRARAMASARRRRRAGEDGRGVVPDRLGPRNSCVAICSVERPCERNDRAERHPIRPGQSAGTPVGRRARRRPTRCSGRRPWRR